jgi:hypothetical protein
MKTGNNCYRICYFLAATFAILSQLHWLSDACYTIVENLFLSAKYLIGTDQPFRGSDVTV